MASTYDKGDLLRLTGTFTNASGTATDPTTITLKIKAPGTALATYTYALSQVTKSSTGVYYKDISLATVGRWFYRWEGTGTVEAAVEGWFEVREARAV
jgi:hypothetical protein